MTIAELKFYINKLSNIPNVIDNGPGEARCREIGEKISLRWGEGKLVYLNEYFRDNIDRNKAICIARVWWN